MAPVCDMDLQVVDMRYRCVVRQECHMEVVRALLSAGAKVNLQAEDGFEPLDMACMEGHTVVVHALL